MIWQPRDIVYQIREAAKMAQEHDRSPADIDSRFLFDELASFADNEGRSDPGLVPYVAEFRKAAPPLWAAAHAAKKDNKPLLSSSLNQAAEIFKDVDLS